MFVCALAFRYRYSQSLCGLGGSSCFVEFGFLEFFCVEVVVFKTGLRLLLTPLLAELSLFLCSTDIKPRTSFVPWVFVVIPYPLGCGSLNWLFSRVILSFLTDGLMCLTDDSMACFNRRCLKKKK